MRAARQAIPQQKPSSLEGWESGGEKRGMDGEVEDDVPTI